MKIGRYRKLVAFAFGTVALFTMRYHEIEIPGLGALWLELGVAAMTGFGVYAAKNDPMDETDA